MTERAALKGAKGHWKDTVDSVNTMIEDLVRPTVEVARVLDAVAEGDLSQKMSLKIQGTASKFQYRPNPMHVMTVDGGDAHTLVKYGPDWLKNTVAQQLAGHENIQTTIQYTTVALADVARDYARYSPLRNVF